MGWRNPFHWLMALATMMLAGLSLSVALTWWGYGTLTGTFPALFKERIVKINSAHDLVRLGRDMAMAEHLWRSYAREEDRVRWQEAAFQIDGLLAFLSPAVHTVEGRRLLMTMAEARSHWDFGMSGQESESWRDLLLSTSVGFASFQQRRMEEDIEEAMERTGRVLYQFGMAASFAGVLVVAAVAIGVIVIRRSLLTTHLVLKSSANTVVVADTRGRVVAVNPTFEQMSGLEGNSLVGKPLEAIGPTGRLLKEVLETGEAKRDQEVRWRLEDDTLKHLIVDLLPWRDGRNRVTGGMAVLRDVTVHRKRQEELVARVEQLHDLAAKDAMTGLYNHRAFMEHLALMVDRARDMNHPLALLMLDLDFFKVYNDTLGHPKGDELLEAFARVLESCLRANDLVGRYGGDEFVAALYGTDSTMATEVAERIRRNVEEHPFPGREVLPNGRLTVSIGIAFFPSSAHNCHDLIRRSDTALYEAKRSARNRVELYYSALEEFRNTLRGEHEEMISTVKSLLTVIHARDRYTFHHSDQVVRYSTWIGRNLGLKDETLQQLRVAALVHDIGKIQIASDILTKAGPLVPSEWNQMREHPLHGANLLRQVPTLSPIVPVVLHHHERWDGSGYPNGLSSDEIPLLSRVISIADSYDAMLSNRPYRRALSRKKALTELRDMAGTQFDPALVDVFIKIGKSINR